MQKQLKKTAIAAGMLALLGGATSAHAAMTYNLAAVNPNDPTWADNGSICFNGGGACPPNGSSAGPWSGDGNPGYSGILPATWIATIENAGGVAASETASSANAGFRVDMGARAYKDGATNWGHTTDFGLFQLQEDAWVTIEVSSDDSELRPAFGLWSNWATSGNRHQSYLGNGAINPMANGIFNSTTLAVIDPNAWAVSEGQGSVGNNVTATLTRYLTAGNYTILLGGYDTPAFLAGQGDGPAFKAYTATISAAAAPVPVPAGAWLFGPALAVLGAARRRKCSVAA